jgi:hypothetical protein
MDPATPPPGRRVGPGVDLPDGTLPAQLLGDGLSTQLELWVAEARAEDAVRRRVAERWLRQQAEENGTLVGVLVDLGERRAPVALHTRSGRVHRGQVTLVGADFTGLTVAGAGEVLVAFAAVSSVRTGPGEALVSGDRNIVTRRTLSEMVVNLAAERERAMLVPVDGTEPVCGTVRVVGQDVVTVQLDGDRPARSAVAYLPLPAIGEVIPGV